MAKTETGSTAGPAKTGWGDEAGGDEARLSTAAGVMAQALTGSDVRTEKVAALQQQIAAGTYSVPASDVADKMVRALMQ